MKIFRIEEFVKMGNPLSGETYKKEILTEDDARKMTGVFGLVVPGSQGGGYHFHESDEHIIIIIKGEGIEIVEGEEIPVKAGDVLFIPAGQKHTTLNRSNGDLRYLGFCTCRTPGKRDVVDVA